MTTLANLPQTYKYNDNILSHISIINILNYMLYLYYDHEELEIEIEY